MNRTHSKGSLNKAVWLVVSLCWFFIVFEGYDLVVYGAVVPSLLAEKQWALTPTQAGSYGSYVVIGMLIGALCVGTLTDLIGRKKTLIACAAVCSIFMAGCAVAPIPALFGLCRFITGIGLGGMMPTITVLTLEYAPPKWKTLTTILMYSGYQLGGIIASLLAINLIPVMGWRIMFWVGIIPLIIIIPLSFFFLPESIAYLAAKGRRQEAERIAERLNISLKDIAPEPGLKAEANGESSGGAFNAVKTLLSKPYRTISISFWVASFAGLFMIFGLNTWLPTIMRNNGYSLGSALLFLLVLNLGTIFGNLLTGAASDRWGIKPVSVFSFLLASVSFILLSFKLPSLFLTYILIAFAGIGSFGTQNLINTYVGHYYPVTSRATALGWSLGVGRLGGVLGPVAGGWFVAWSLGVQWHFGLFALIGLVGALALAMIPPVVRHAKPVSPGQLDKSSSPKIGPL